jgi:hypothetical protein
MQMFAYRVFWLVLGACSFTPPTPSSDATDPGPVTIGFEASTSTADERSDTVRIAVVLSQASDVPVTVAYAIVGGTATAGSDFTAAAGSMLTFAAGATRQEVAIRILSDADETEPNETIDLTLSSPSGAMLGTQTTHTVTISNVLLPRVEVAAVTTTPEGSQTVVTVTLDKAAQGASTVMLALGGGDATPGDDFTLTDGTVITIPAGAVSGTAPIGEVDDLLDEVDETVIFTLTNPSSNIIIGAAASSTHTIVDDDAEPTVQFTEATSTVSEATSTANIEVTLTAVSGKTVTVSFSRDANDSAAANDATLDAAPGTLTFAPGEVSKTITMSIVNDTRDEDDEAVIAILSNPGNATLGTAVHTATITDDDLEPSVSFQSSSSSAREDAFFTFIGVTVTLSRASGKTVSAPFTRSGTASVGSDYGTSATPVTFAPGETSKTIIIDWTNDSNNESNETVILTLDAPVNAVLGIRPSHTFTIFDDD